MATVQNPVTGRSKGKFANAVFSKWKGRNTLRSKPLEVANPQSDAQTQQRDSFAAAMAFARSISSIVYVGFAQFKDTISEYNAFMKEAYTGWVDKSLTPPAFQFDWPLLVVSKGPIAPTPIVSITATNADQDVHIVYSNTVDGSGQALSDLAYAVVYNETQDLVSESLASDTRSTGTITATLPANAATGDVIHVYLFFKAADSVEVSDSQYDTVTVS